MALSRASREQTSAVFSEDEIEKQLARILQAPGFANSPRLSRLLAYLVEHSFAAEQRELQEYAVGVGVFDRGKSFDPSRDTIVRVNARRMRERLEKYYANEGRSDAIVMQVPKGHYRVLFRSSACPVLSIEDRPALIVLPFTDMSPAQDQQYFSDGLAEEVRYRLAQLKGLQVIGRTTTFSFKDTGLTLRAIAAELNVGHVLEGSTRRFADRIKITAQLVDAANGLVLWSENYNRDMQDIFAVQDEIARSVATALSIKLGVGDIQGLTGSTTNVDAYNEVLRGQVHYRQFNPDSVLAAIDHFRRAIALDPEYAHAWERLADIYTTSRLFLSPVQMGGNWQALSEQALNQALMLLPDSPQVLETMAFRQVHLGQWAEAERTYARRAALLATTGIIDNFPTSRLLIEVGRMQEAVQVLEGQRRSDPRSAIVSFYLGNAYANTGQLSLAAQELERGYQLGNYRSLLLIRGWITALISGDKSSLQQWQLRAWEIFPQMKGPDSTMLGLQNDSQAAIQWLRANYREPGIIEDWVVSWAAYHGDVDLVLEVLNEWEMGYWDYWSPLLTDVRRQEGFKQLVIKRGLVEYWREFGWGDYCRPLGDNDFECF